MLTLYLPSWRDVMSTLPPAELAELVALLADHGDDTPADPEDG